MCRRIPQLVPRLLSGELPTSEARRIDLHLSLCEPCRKAASGQGYEQAVATESATERDFLSDMRTKLASQVDTPIQAHRPALSLGWVVAAVVVCVGIAAVFFQIT